MWFRCFCAARSPSKDSSLAQGGRLRVLHEGFSWEEVGLVHKVNYATQHNSFLKGLTLSFHLCFSGP